MMVSVIVPAYNASATIGRLIKALLAQEYSDLFEIIIVDDGSTDETASLIKRFEQVHYVYQENAGPAAARNLGARLAKGKFLCFTDSDCMPHPNWIQLLLKGFSRSDIAVVAGSYGIANPQSLLARGIQAEICFRHTRLMPDYPKAFGSYNFCIKKEIFDNVGGFQQGYRQASGEDNDLSYKIIKTGQLIYFERQALVDHYHTTKFIKYLKEQFRHGFWRVKMYATHPSMAKGDDYTFWKDIIEVPWVGICLSVAVLNIVGLMTLKAVVFYLFVTLLLLEIIFAQKMLVGFFEYIYFGFVMFFRAFARTFGLSTGFFYFFWTKIKKKFK